MPSRPRRSHAHRGSGSRRGAGLFAAALVAAGFLLLTAEALLSARRALVHGGSELRIARASVTAHDAGGAKRALDRAQRNFGRARRGARVLPLRALGPVPVLGGLPRGAEAAARAGDIAAEAGRIAVEVSEPYSRPAEGEDGSFAVAAVHDASVRTGTALAEVDGRLAAAAAVLDGAAGAALPWVASPAQRLQAELARSRKDLARAVEGLAVVAELTGPGTDLRLLVVAQDSLELRPTGGYIGSFGVIRIRGQAAALERYDAVDVLPAPDPPLEPPAVLADALPGAWGLSNVNWWPDFPTTATVAREMFRRQGGGEVDGVLALTEHAVGRLVGAVEPVSVPGFEPPVVEAGFSQRLLYEVEQRGPYVEHRKQFMAELARAMFDRLLQVPADKLGGVAEAVAESAGTGDVQVWFADARVEERIARTVVAGRLPRPASGDFLMLVDANLLASKANAGLVKQADYRVRRRADGQLVARLTVTVHNEGGPTRTNPLYLGYLRVYAPRGARLVESSAGTVRAEGPAADGPFEVFAQALAVPARDRQVLRFDYVLPPSVARPGGYRLTWVRQVGTAGDRLHASMGAARADMAPGQRILRLEASSRGAGWLARVLGIER